MKDRERYTDEVLKQKGPYAEWVCNVCCASQFAIPASPALVVELHGACPVVSRLINIHLSIP